MWPFRRQRDAAGADSGVVYRQARNEWRTLPPMPTVQPTIATVDTGFEQVLATRADPSFLSPLGHQLRADAPSGRVDGLGAPTAEAPRPLVAQRTFPTPATGLPQWIGPAPVDRQTDATSGQSPAALAEVAPLAPGRGTPSMVRAPMVDVAPFSVAAPAVQDATRSWTPPADEVSPAGGSESTATDIDDTSPAVTSASTHVAGTAPPVIGQRQLLGSIPTPVADVQRMSADDRPSGEEPSVAARPTARPRPRVGAPIEGKPPPVAQRAPGSASAAAPSAGGIAAEPFVAAPGGRPSDPGDPEAADAPRPADDAPSNAAPADPVVLPLVGGPASHDGIAGAGTTHPPDPRHGASVPAATAPIVSRTALDASPSATSGGCRPGDPPASMVTSDTARAADPPATAGSGGGDLGARPAEPLPLLSGGDTEVGSGDDHPAVVPTLGLEPLGTSLPSGPGVAAPPGELATVDVGRATSANRETLVPTLGEMAPTIGRPSPLAAAPLPTHGRDLPVDPAAPAAVGGHPVAARSHSTPALSAPTPPGAAVIGAPAMVVARSALDAAPAPAARGVRPEVARWQLDLVGGRIPIATPDHAAVAPLPRQSARTVLDDPVVATAVQRSVRAPTAPTAPLTARQQFVAPAEPSTWHAMSPPSELPPDRDLADGGGAMPSAMVAVQRAPETASPPAEPPATTETTTSAAVTPDMTAPPAAKTPTEAELQELVRSLYPPLRRRLCRDLLLDRERAGYRTDIRF